MSDLIEEVMAYTQHHAGCSYYRPTAKGTYCDCGLDETAAALRAALVDQSGGGALSSGKAGCAEAAEQARRDVAEIMAQSRPALNEVWKQLFEPARFANSIRAKMEADGLDQKGASLQSGVSEATLSRILACKTRPDVEHYMRLKAWLCPASPPHGGRILEGYRLVPADWLRWVRGAASTLASEKRPLTEGQVKVLDTMMFEADAHLAAAPVSPLREDPD